MLLLLALPVLLSAQTCPGALLPLTATISYSGHLSSVPTPPLTQAIILQAFGAGGAGGRYSNGGAGAYITGTLLPSPASPLPASLTIAAGGGGQRYPATVPWLGGQGTARPNNFQCIGTGAGATAIFAGDSGALLLVAGAGGGGGEQAGFNGGAATWDGSTPPSASGIAAAAASNCACQASCVGWGGRAASNTSAGGAGCGVSVGTWGAPGTGPITLAQLATGSPFAQECGGMGGGGLYGGGGGGWHGGGGSGSAGSSPLLAGVSGQSASGTTPGGAALLAALAASTVPAAGAPPLAAMAWQW